LKLSFVPPVPLFLTIAETPYLLEEALVTTRSGSSLLPNAYSRFPPIVYILP
jgi:hypothetical protein